MCISVFFLCVTSLFKTHTNFKISVFPRGNESQIPLIEYSKTTNSTASLVAAISKKLQNSVVTYSAKAVERAE
mgnify:CR=1 FL=1